ncbi:hypothetical protein C6W19_11740 [Bacillus sp. RJGP41]|nr:hypothetical protein C6W19_11740 [Bacillus sp. RJGP41]
MYKIKGRLTALKQFIKGVGNYTFRTPFEILLNFPPYLYEYTPLNHFCPLGKSSWASMNG